MQTPYIYKERTFKVYQRRSSLVKQKDTMSIPEGSIGMQKGLIFRNKPGWRSAAQKTSSKNWKNALTHVIF